MKPDKKVSVLFVCMGNICRSPTGEGVFQYHVDKQGYSEQIEVDSAGTIAYHAGEAADARMRTAANKRGYQLLSRARKIIENDLETFDLIVPMDTDNLFDIESMSNGSKSYIRLLGSFIDGYNGNDDAPSVPDPYYGGSAGFEQVLDMIESACPKMLSHCLDLLKQKA